MSKVPHKQTVAMRYVPALLDRYNEVSGSEIGGQDYDVMIRDLMTDLMHMAAANEYDFGQLMEDAASLYREETRPED